MGKILNMNNELLIPNLTGGPGAEVKKQVKTTFILDCPKCKKKLDVTSLAFGTTIECPKCKNVTFRPAYNPPWWLKLMNKGWKALITGIMTFGLGYGSSYLATYVYERNNIESQPRPIEVTPKKNNQAKNDLIENKVISGYAIETVTVLNLNSPMQNREVKITIGNNFFTGVTDSNGVAKIKITIPFDKSFLYKIEVVGTNEYVNAKIGDGNIKTLRIN